ncbi:type III-B CRISPR module RAMP protein Cmr6 [Clostridium fermenticellae]|nr:type III-B CRISPR module RAMP protein Cmr6 [Clostridium fermenticellae]
MNKKFKRDNKKIDKNNNNKLLSKLSFDDFKNLNLGKDNLTYFLKKFVIEDEKSRIFIGKLKNDTKIRSNKVEELFMIKQKTEYIENYKESIKNYCEELSLEFFDKIEKKTSYKLVVGLGNPSVTETAITLHHTYGIPYIPGQALKGSARSYFLELYYNIKTKKFIDEENYNLDKLEITYRNMYKYIFGDDIHGEDNEKGSVIFFDDFPLNEVIIEKDVTTPHYGKYYKNVGSPVDEFYPNPISFYTIKNTYFNFMIAINKNKMNLDYNKYDYLKNFVLNLIESMLEEHGLGSKTSVGYGRFV